MGLWKMTKRNDVKNIKKEKNKTTGKKGTERKIQKTERNRKGSMWKEKKKNEREKWRTMRLQGGEKKERWHQRILATHWSNLY